MPLGIYNQTSHSILDRFLRRIAIGNDFWLWLGRGDRFGYGSIRESRPNNSLWKAHRFSYKLFRGTHPSHLCVLHHCDRPSCVNPSHLFLGDRVDNNKDMLDKGRFRPHSASGESNPAAKLTVEQVREIRSQYSLPTMSTRRLASKYSVSRRTIQFILSRQHWKI